MYFKLFRQKWGASHFATAAFAYRIKKFGIIRILSDYPVFGGPEETRTLDLSDANRTLSQLSYRPIFMNFFRVNRVAPA